MGEGIWEDFSRKMNANQLKFISLFLIVCFITENTYGFGEKRFRP